MEYKYKPRLGYGISLGLVHPNDAFDVFPLSPSQNDFPGLVFNGVSIRANYSFAPIHHDYYEFYISPQLMYKYLWYNNHEFWDSWVDSDDNWYTRDEKTSLYGFDFLVGWNFFPGKEEWRINVYLNLHAGAGIRYRYRNITNNETRVEGFPDTIVKLG